MSESKSTNEQNGISPQSNKCVTSEDPRFTQIISPFTALSLQFQPQYHLNGYDTLSLHVNIRKVYHSRLFCVKPSDNVLLMLMNEQPQLTSMLDAKFEVVLTSYDEINEEMEVAIPLESVSDSVPTKFKAIPLTINIVENAIVIVKRLDDHVENAIAIVKRLDDQTHNDNQSPNVPTMEECVKRYLKILDGIMKKTNNEEALLAFCHKVYAQSKDELVESNSDGDDDDSDGINNDFEFDSMTVPQLRQFIIDTIARWTRIIIHVMDGIHRLTAYRLAMTNDIADYHLHLIQDVKAYANVDPNPHMKQEMTVKILVPTCINDDKIKYWRDISAVSQINNGNASEHGVREFVKNIIERLGQHSYLKENGYLLDEDSKFWQTFHKKYWSIEKNDNLYGDNSEVINEIFAPFMDVPETQKFFDDETCSYAEDLPELYIKAWLKKMISVIRDTLTSDNLDTKTKRMAKSLTLYKTIKSPNIDFLSLIPLEEWYLLVKVGSSKEYKTQMIPHLYDKQMRLDYQLDPKNATRYSRGQWDAFMVDLVQLLLYKATSPYLSKLLVDHFSTNKPTSNQSSPGGDNEVKESITCIVQCNTIAIDSSYTQWKKSYFVKNNRESADPSKFLNRNTVFVLLLQSSLSSTIKFFSKLGENPDKQYPCQKYQYKETIVCGDELLKKYRGASMFATGEEETFTFKISEISDIAKSLFTKKRSYLMHVADDFCHYHENVVSQTKDDSFKMLESSLLNEHGSIFSGYETAPPGTLLNTLHNMTIDGKGSIDPRPDYTRGVDKTLSSFFSILQSAKMCYFMDKQLNMIFSESKDQHLHHKIAKYMSELLRKRNPSRPAPKIKMGLGKKLPSVKNRGKHLPSLNDEDSVEDSSSSSEESDDKSSVKSSENENDEEEEEEAEDEKESDNDSRDEAEETEDDAVASGKTGRRQGKGKKKVEEREDSSQEEEEEEGAGQKKAKQKKKRNRKSNSEGDVTPKKRRRTGYNLFQKHANIPKNTPLADKSGLYSRLWKLLSPEQRQVYNEKAKNDDSENAETISNNSPNNDGSIPPDNSQDVVENNDHLATDPHSTANNQAHGPVAGNVNETIHDEAATGLTNNVNPVVELGGTEPTLTANSQEHGHVTGNNEEETNHRDDNVEETHRLKGPPEDIVPNKDWERENALAGFDPSEVDNASWSKCFEELSDTQRAKNDIRLLAASDLFDSLKTCFNLNDHGEYMISNPAQLKTTLERSEEWQKQMKSKVTINLEE